MEENETYQGSIACLHLYLYLMKIRTFFSFPIWNRFSYVFWGIALAFIDKNKLSINFCLVFVWSVWHAIISTQKIHFDAGFCPWQTRLVTIHGQYYNRVWWSKKPKVTREIETSGFQQYIPNACPGITWNTAAPGVVPTIQKMSCQAWNNSLAPSPPFCLFGFERIR